MDGEVIVDGSTSCMPSSVATVADRLTQAGWATAAFGTSSLLLLLLLLLVNAVLSHRLDRLPPGPATHAAADAPTFRVHFPDR